MILDWAVHTPPGNLAPAAHQTGDLLQITKYRVARDAAAHRFPQVSELIKAAQPGREESFKRYSWPARPGRA